MLTRESLVGRPFPPVKQLGVLSEEWGLSLVARLPPLHMIA